MGIEGCGKEGISCKFATEVVTEQAKPLPKDRNPARIGSDGAVQGGLPKQLLCIPSRGLWLGKDSGQAEGVFRRRHKKDLEALRKWLGNANQVGKAIAVGIKGAGPQGRRVPQEPPKQNQNQEITRTRLLSQRPLQPPLHLKRVQPDIGKQRNPDLAFCPR